MARRRDKHLFVSGIPMLFCGLLAVDATAQTKPMVAEILPPAKGGECYAKVSVPAKYRTETVDVLLKEPTERFQITPARFEERTKQVMTREASTELEAVQPELAVEEDSFLAAPARTEWVRDSIEGTIPVSEGEKRDLNIAGINLANVSAGSCLYEHYSPAVIKEIPNQVLISEATEELSVSPAKYRKGTESVLVKPAHKRLIEVPAVFKQKQESVLVEAAHSIWQKGTGPIQRIDNLSGEIMCLVDIPAKYETIDVEVIGTAPLVTSVDEPAEYETINIEKLDSDATEKRVVVPAKFKTMNKLQVQKPGGFTWLTSRSKDAEDGEPTGRVICNKAIPANVIAYERTVVKKAGKFVKTAVPAQFEDVEVMELASDASSVKVPVPGLNSQVERRVKVEDARFEWMSVLCETNTTDDIISRLQSALASEGYEVGKIDGVLGNGTLNALAEYQKKNNLAEGGVTMESIKALGVKL
jgi:hypothetical protein